MRNQLDFLCLISNIKGACGIIDTGLYCKPIHFLKGGKDMRRWIIHLVMTVIGASLGVAVVPSILKVFGWDKGILQNEAVDCVIGAIIFIILSFIFAGSMLNGLKK